MSSESELKQAGLKVTLPRVKILQILDGCEKHHLSAEDIYRQLLMREDEIGIATVYRVLTQFEDAGLVIRHNFEGGSSVFELANADHHDHLVCVRCGRVEEFQDEVIEERQEAIAARLSFTLTNHQLNLYGLCPECQKS